MNALDASIIVRFLMRNNQCYSTAMSRWSILNFINGWMIDSRFLWIVPPLVQTKDQIQNDKASTDTTAPHHPLSLTGSGPCKTARISHKTSLQIKSVIITQIRCWLYVWQFGTKNSCCAEVKYPANSHFLQTELIWHQKWRNWQSGTPIGNLCSLLSVFKNRVTYSLIIVHFLNS